MTGITSNVYDLVYPSPITLKELSTSALVAGLWRWKVKNHMNDDFGGFLSNLDMPKNLDPAIPSTIERTIDEYINRFIFCVGNWSGYHYEKLFRFHRNNATDILRDFCDFICDPGGDIHYVGTAKRMMVCDRLSNDEKFKIACMYCFDDDIRRIWPSVSEKLDLNEIDFDVSPELFYWICTLRNETNRIPNLGDDFIDEFMLEACSSRHWSSVEYFWNRIRPENRLVEAINLSRNDKESFVRFILPKLSDKLLDKFVIERASDLIYALLTNSHDKFYALPTWMYIRNKMSEDDFTNLIELIMKTETDHHIAKDPLSEDSTELEDWSSTDDETYLCCEIWKNSPDKLKRSAVKNILPQGHLFERDSVRPTEFREIRFLLTVLLDASFKERSAFWHTNWSYLINATRAEDLHRIMKLCFKNEDDIVQFKETTMSEFENIGEYCITVMELGYFEELNDLLTFCCPETQKRRDLKQRLVRSCFLSDIFALRVRHLTNVESMNEFINDSFDNDELAADFKNELVSFSTLECILHQCICLAYSCSPNHLIHFIDTLVSADEIKSSLKESIVDFVKDRLIDGYVQNTSADNLQKILIWCLGNEDEVINFKQSLSVYDFFPNVKELNPSERRAICTEVGGFLRWYFRSPEETEEFERWFADQ